MCCKELIARPVKWRHAHLLCQVRFYLANAMQQIISAFVPVIVINGLEVIQIAI